ncbi:MAG TPA: hypothetical protein DGT23_35210 [Micromonosporaceae bacterium]|nr:hypothetical protein [Micromonosporaceae bacterium]
MGTGGGVGSGPPSGGPASGFAPVGGGPGVPGSEVRGPGGRAFGGEPHAAARGGAGGAVGRSGALGGIPMAAGGRGRREDDIERSAPEYLREDDPEALFGTDEPTAPPVIGEDDPPVPADKDKDKEG